MISFLLKNTILYLNIHFVINLYFSCEDCVLLDSTLKLIKSLIDSNTHLPENQRHRYQSVFKRQFELIQEWKKHQLRTVHQETAKDWVLEQLDETSVSKFSFEFFCLTYRKRNS